MINRVRWTESVQYMIAHGVTDFLELGSGSVIVGMIKRIDRQANGYTLGSPTDFAKLPN
jgi:[acyl-carrier-protein] S-malonyltransferase